ncbi:TadE/TadG family type IV pilus assembly protein [Noviherbaspirillum cavernae]|uniref:TadE/TadG family type IV pilus assembly protein n=1 Tax=Noviherbaspirillum cavernae TaxID=2320862 RepID=UPI001313FC29|nr:TadE/TadG family type IV pilus assembly protein [Noviherbaspirillum cavernae]
MAEDEMRYARQRGSQIVEFAFVLPVLVLMLLLIVDFGFLVYNKAVITNASREGARFGTVLTATPWTTASVAAVACNYARNSVINVSTGTRNANCTGTADPTIVVSNPNGNVPPHFNDPVTVTVTYAYSGFLLNTANAKFGTFPLSLTAASTMAHE